MKNPLITMSAVTGKPDRERIFEYLKGLKDGGIEQVLIYPRSGCEIEYLSEEWFLTIGNFIECAKELDMCLWLYDDFNWPSGDAGVRVTSVKEYRLRAIATRGEHAGEISYKSRHNSGLFGEKYFPDLLSCEAVEYFIKCTHEEYYKRFSEYFGTVIQGIFTDEPSIGYCCEGYSIPYYDGIENGYAKLCKRNFLSDMENGYEDFYLNAVTVISNRFNSCYIKRLREWCEGHRIIMTGHLMCDSDPFYTTKHNGNFLKNLSSFMLPGIDDIYTDFTDKSQLTLLGAAEYSHSDYGAMAELFALGPCDMSYAKKRCMIYLAAAFKINRYFLAISHLDMRGNMLVTDFFNNFSTDQPDFCGMRLLAREAEQASVLAGKDYSADVYIRYPFFACAKKITEDVDINCFWELVNKLTYTGIQWKFIDNEAPTDAPIIELNDRLEFMLEGKTVQIDEVCKKIKSKIAVKDENSHTPSGIFVRKLADGSMIIINLFAPAGKYTVNGKELFLDKYDVKFSLEEDAFNKEELTADFDVRYNYSNMIRTMYINGAENAEVYCQQDTSVIFAVRADTSACLNGEAIICHKDTGLLFDGIKDLYKISDPVSLKKGFNTVRAENDLKYMPAVFLIGEFSADCVSGDICKLVLSPRKSTYTCGDAIYDYGCVEFTKEILVPQRAVGIEIIGTGLYTSVFADDISLGEKITSPYIFQIDKSLWGKHITLRLVQHSSLGNIFGDVAFWDKISKKSQWRGTPSPQRSSFGFKQINWLFHK